MAQFNLVEQRGGDNYDPDLIALRGYLSSPAQSGFVRLFLNTGLTDFLEFKLADIVDQAKVPAGGLYPLESMIVWISKQTQVSFGHNAASGVQSQFLSGPISSSFLLGSAQVQMPIGQLIGTLSWICPSPGSACCGSKPPCGEIPTQVGCTLGCSNVVCL
jgi:hypothetical protein